MGILTKGDSRRGVHDGGINEGGFTMEVLTKGDSRWGCSRWGIHDGDIHGGRIDVRDIRRRRDERFDEGVIDDEGTRWRIRREGEQR